MQVEAASEVVRGRDRVQVEATSPGDMEDPLTEACSSFQRDIRLTTRQTKAELEMSMNWIKFNLCSHNLCFSVPDVSETSNQYLKCGSFFPRGKPNTSSRLRPADAEYENVMFRPNSSLAIKFLDISSLASG